MAVAKGQVVVSQEIVDLINETKNKIQNQIVWKRGQIPVDAESYRFDSGSLASASSKLHVGDIIDAKQLMQIFNDLSYNWSAVRRMHYSRYYNTNGRISRTFEQTQISHLTNSDKKSLLYNPVNSNEYINSGDEITAEKFTGVLGLIYRNWQNLGVIDYSRTICHSNCHNSCHGSGGWR